MHVAIVCSAHGYGHFARQCAVAHELTRRGASVTVFGDVPDEVAKAGLEGSGARFVRVRADVGLIQRDSVSEDLDATAERAEASLRSDRIDALARALAGADQVLVDAAPQALEAARRAGIAATAVGNFDWATIYARYPGLSHLAERFAELQAPHTALELEPGIGMHGFKSVERAGLLARASVARRVVPPGEHQAVVCFSSGLADVDALLPVIEGVRWVLSPPLDPIARADCTFEPAGDFRSLVAGASFVLTKPGYGIYGECAVAGVRVAYLDRGTFPEAPALEAALAARGDVKVAAKTRDAVERAVRELIARSVRPERADAPAARVIADAVFANR